MMESCAPGEMFASLAALPAAETILETTVSSGRAAVRKGGGEDIG